jgi:hypothetical protein
MGKSLDRLLAGVDWRCTKCGAKQGACNCRVKITLRCPTCGRTKQSTKDDTDPEGTAVVEIACDKHPAEGCGEEVHYYDAKGRWWNGEQWVKP